ncbi:MAG: AAA family ATPase [Acetobacteraceae bacterium]|nr:AAA family ATPase [Acetobacteraceae bacterium]
MATVFTVAQRKGGAGKTTLAANLAAAFARECRVATIDIDPQRSLARWHALRAQAQGAPAIHLADLSGWRLPAEIARLRRSHDLIIVDSPPQIDTDAKLAIRGADLVLVPVQPSPPDLWAAEATLKLAAGEGRHASIVLNRAPASGKLRREVERDIAAKSFAVMRTTLGNRTGFAGAFARGLGITETEPNSVGGRELAALAAELRERLG